MDFDNQKKQALAKADKSNIGKVDKRIKPLVDLINSNKDYFTTSSCSGRIGLLTDSIKGKTEWVFKSHEPVKTEQIINALKSHETLWFRQEALILHICARNLDAAQRLIKLANDTGFKRAGIISLQNRIIIEIKSDEIIYTIISKKLAPEYLELLVKKANEKLDANFDRIKELQSKLER